MGHIQIIQSHTGDGSLKLQMRIKLQNSANGGSPTDKKNKQKTNSKKSQRQSPLQLLILLKEAETSYRNHDLHEHYHCVVIRDNKFIP